jgi:type I restriction enzyme, R subunit
LSWKLFQSRWNLSGEPIRRPRILFLADRNILADQGYNAFSAFPEDALVRISPDEIRKKGRVPKNGSIFFTIFQTFMSGRDAEGNSAPSFGDYSRTFSISSSSTSATGAARTMRATGAGFWSISRPPCSSV